MSPTWDPGGRLDLPDMTAGGWVRFVLRLVPTGVVTFGGLVLLLALRLVERPLFGLRRPVTPFITQTVCRIDYRIMGIRRTTRGQPMKHPGALVANHVSWLDIFTLNALDRIYFVAKREVAGWAGIGWLARATGTLFIERRRGAAGEQRDQFHARLLHGHRLFFFPEGTSTDGRRVLDFKSTPFAAFFDEAHRQELWIQPVTQVYTAPEGRDPRFYGWWGDADFLPHLRAVLAQKNPGAVEVIFHDPVRAADYPDRKALAQALTEKVRAGLDGAQAMAAK